LPTNFRCILRFYWGDLVETSLAAEPLLCLAVTITSEHKVEPVLQNVVRGLAAQPGVALARIWLLPSGDLCGAGHSPTNSPGQTDVLHLVASAGTPVNSPGEDWSSLRGHFSRVPLNSGKVGQVAGSRNPILINDFAPHDEWILRPEWAERERIRSFAGHPLIFRDNLLGVLGVFSRRPLAEREFTWLGLFANQAAVAIANARAFEEVERLRRQLEGEKEYLQEQVQQGFEFGEILGKSRALQEVLRQIQMVAPTNSTVLIGGESGTGKELVARAIHDLSQRHERALITVNCASIPRELFESEFFGHVKGAFTGALRDRIGRFQLADKGTLFLDEVGEIPFELQSKLLRVLQEGTLERVGEDHVRHVDVRVVAATNRELFEDVEAGRFRKDLYYRLCVFPLRMPPLRDRSEDIRLLAEHFALLASQRLKIPHARLTDSAMELLTAYAWPGNVRELQNVIERAVIVSQGGPLRVDVVLGPCGKKLHSAAVSASIFSRAEMERRDEQNILKALERAQGKIYGPDGAAAILGMKPTTLTSRMKKMKIGKS
jgi:transcriptional regulator with GAF, ATPase, and Fis domain